MRKNSEVRNLTVLGDVWEIELEYDEGELANIRIDDGDEHPSASVRVRAGDSYDLEVIARNLHNIAKQLKDEEYESNA